MKIGIITLYGEDNYGNKLQNYALKKILEKFSQDVETIKLDLIENKTIKYYCNKFTIKLFFRYIFLKVIGLNRKIKNINRKKTMKEFSNQNLNVKGYRLTKEEFNSLNVIYDKLVIGSDQVWNHNFVRKMLDWYFVIFSPKDKNIAYSASFGIDEIEDELKDQYIKGLNNMSYISVREEQGAKIVKDLIKKDVPVLVDPTMLLSIEEWNKIIKSPKHLPKNKYILTYFLGNYSSERKENIYNFAKKNNIDVINLARLEYKKYYAKSPGEFIWYIKNASIIITDSFHGTVFSLLYKVPFYTMNREDKTQSMSSRIDTLLKMFNFEERLINDNKFDMNFNCNFNNVNVVLNSEKKRSFDYLSKAFELKENYIEN
ncbi:MAG: polysaccharide pyruvyl transferase family protein [Clostridia bacterium]|nr:polysaccharide pyruvyl transferase family protein [Clostridia bacterium]